MQQRWHDIRSTNTAFYGDLRTQQFQIFSSGKAEDKIWQQALSNHHANQTLLKWNEHHKEDQFGN
jgi:hypothetical protein